MVLINKAWNVLKDGLIIEYYNRFSRLKITKELITQNAFLMRVNSSFFLGGKIPIILTLEKVFRKINFQSCNS